MTVSNAEDIYRLVPVNAESIDNDYLSDTKSDDLFKSCDK